MMGDNKLKDDSDQPKLYLQVRLCSYSSLQFCERIKRIDIQRLFNVLGSKRSSMPSNLLAKKLDAKITGLGIKFEYLKSLNKFNFDKDLTGYIYGYPPKRELDLMQVQLRTHTGDRYLLLRVNETVKNDSNFESTGNQAKVKKKEIVVSADLLFMIFKKLLTNPLANTSTNENFVLELYGYRFKTILIIIYALYTNQFYLTLDTFPEIIQISLDLGIEQILKFLNRLVMNDDPIYLLFKLRNYLHTDSSPTCEMIYILKQVLSNYQTLIDHPGILDLNFNEINFLVCKKKTIFQLFKVDMAREESQVIKAVLDWYMIKSESRAEGCICLLNKIDYANLSIDQLDKLVNHLLLNNYSDDVKRHLKGKLNNELKKRKEFSGYFQVMAKLSVSDCSSLRAEVITSGRPVELSEKMLIGLKTTIKANTDRAEQEQEAKELFNDYFKNLIHLGSFSLVVTSSPIYSINEKSIMLLLGGFKSHLPYPKDQGRLMYHLIRTQHDENSTPISLPSIMSHDWFPLQERLPRNLAHFVAIRILNCIFIIGGLDLNYLLLHNERKQVRPVSNCFVLNLTTNSWYKIKNMHLSRAFHCAIKCDNLIYVFGGITYHTQTNSLLINNTMEFYDISKNLWFLVFDHQSTPSIMPSPRMAFGMELIDSNTICIVGGISNLEDKNLNYNSSSLLSDFWCFNLDNRTFHQQPNLRLPNSRASFALIKHQHELLLIGGIECGMGVTRKMTVTTKNVLTCKIEKIEKSDKPVEEAWNSSEWKQHSKLNQQRIFPLVCKYLNTILVAGGKTQDHFYLKKISLTNYCSTYEVLNSETLKWVESPKLFSTVGSCLVSLI